MSARWEALWYPSEPLTWAERSTRWPLAIPAFGWRTAMGIRNALYNMGALRTTHIEDVRVISVGNLTVGGAGKTPAVIWLARHLSGLGHSVAVLTRGYGRRSTEEVVLSGTGKLPPVQIAGDEPLLIARRCPGVRVLVGPSRAHLAQRAQSELGVSILLLDDGFQHRQLARDVDIVVVDEQSGFGNQHALPWGPLREPLRALQRATLIWLRTAEGGTRPRPLPLPKGIPVVRARYAAREALSPEGRVEDARSLEGENVLALTGLARPGSFIRTLELLGAQVRARHLVADHHFYTAAELEAVRSLAEREHLTVVTTEKDRERLPSELRTWVVRLDVEVLEGRQLLDAALGVSAVH